MAARRARLLYVGGFDFPGTRARGIQTLHTAHALARAGWQVRLLVQRPAEPLVPAESALADYGLKPEPGLRIASLPVVRLDRFPSIEIHKRLAVTNWSYALGCVKDLLGPARDADLVLVRDPRLAWAFLKTRQLSGRPVVYEVHEVFSTRPRDNRTLDRAGIWGVARRTLELERAVFRDADMLLTLTHACASYLTDEFGVAAGSIAVVPDGTSDPPPVVGPIDWERPRVAYAGQLYPWKGVDTLLRAVATAPEVELSVLGGNGPDDADLRACRRLADDLGIADRTRFEGFVPHCDVRSRLAGAVAAVAPLPDNLMARYFTSPLKVFDYMAAGVPIVASDLPSLREVLRDGDNALLVPPTDPGSMAAAIRRLLTDRALAERIRQRALEDVAHFTWACRAERISRAVAPILGGQRRDRESLPPRRRGASLGDPHDATSLSR